VRVPARVAAAWSSPLSGSWRLGACWPERAHSARNGVEQLAGLSVLAWVAEHGADCRPGRGGVEQLAGLSMPTWVAAAWSRQPTGVRQSGGRSPGHYGLIRIPCSAAAQIQRGGPPPLRGASRERRRGPWRAAAPASRDPEEEDGNGVISSQCDFHRFLVHRILCRRRFLMKKRFLPSLLSLFIKSFATSTNW
jgi:hypothetical protein